MGDDLFLRQGPSVRFGALAAWFACLTAALVGTFHEATGINYTNIATM